jgi:hypothetical protein
MNLKSVVVLIFFALAGCSSSIKRREEPLALYIVRDGVSFAGPFEVPLNGLGIDKKFELEPSEPSGSVSTINIFADVAYPVGGVIFYHCSVKTPNLLSMGETTATKISSDGVATLRCGGGINMMLKAPNFKLQRTPAAPLS